MAEYIFYTPGYAVPKNPDILSLAYFLDAKLLSIPTENQWESSQVIIARTTNGRFINEHLLINNISCHKHGIELLKTFNEIDISRLCENCCTSSEFINWHESLTKENKHRVINKLKLACTRDFQGGEPLFKSLSNNDGLREIRFSAYPGGATRILFKGFGNNKQAILIGFIKKSDNEGYENNIRIAAEVYSSFVLKKHNK
ncbi:type II toxin-antitoxin system RelE/ParE family toxin [Iodobacter sp.]|uniref:type II toxin-antitoxin system RelE/ParE family toxin n=1 Tax=Iodobacter sp. TaxID=1915058 RepID=UPI0025FAFFF0|nr:type II toxin-antitoxin system RelE/ParE family toxin [Iodobacter sp.]